MLDSLDLRSTIRWGAEADRFEDVAKIAVLRGGGLGDLLSALPAVAALAAAYPAAEVALLGTALHQSLLQGRPSPVDQVHLLPVARGVHESANASEDHDATSRFVYQMRARKFDLAVQLHGGGRYSNPFLTRLGARHTVGTATADAIALERTLPYLYYQSEVLRWLETVSLAGAPPVALEPELQVTPHDRLLADQYLSRIPAASDPLLVIHPGATDPRRRWPAERFSDLARNAVADGYRVVVLGDGSEAALADAIVASAADGAARHPRLVSAAGRLSLAELVGVLSRADVFAGNDSGPRHLAQAVGTATVGIYWVGNLINAGPLSRARNRVHLSWVTRCPVCGRDSSQPGWTAERCEHDVSFVEDVPVAEVYADVVTLTATTAPPRDK